MKTYARLLILLFLLANLVGCSAPPQSAPPEPTATPSVLPSSPPTATDTPVPSATPPLVITPEIPTAAMPPTPMVSPTPQLSPLVYAVLQGHSDIVNAVRISPDGRYVASASEDGNVILWDLATQSLRMRLHGHTAGVLDVDFSTDSQRVVSASRDRTLRVWDTLTGQVMAIMEGHHKSLAWSGAFNQDGLVVASGSGEGFVYFWDGNTGEYTGFVDVRPLGEIWSVDWIPVNRLVVAIAGSKGVRVYMTETDNTVARIPGSTSSIVFSPNGEKVFTAGSSVGIWETFGGKLLGKLIGHTDWVWSIAASSDNKQVVTGSKDRTVRLWDVETRRMKQVLEGFPDSVKGVAFSPDNETLAVASGKQIYLVWLGKGEPPSAQPLQMDKASPTPIVIQAATAQPTTLPTHTPQPSATQTSTPAQWASLTPDINRWEQKPDGNWISLVYKPDSTCQVNVNRSIQVTGAEISGDEVTIANRIWQRLIYKVAGSIRYEAYQPAFMGQGAPIYSVSAPDACRGDLMNLFATLPK